MKKVLITGMAGLVGSVIQKHLTKDFLLSSLDLVDIPNIKSFKEDITNLDSIKHVFNNQDAVIHLAADPNGGATWDSILPNNIIGTLPLSKLASPKDTLLFQFEQGILGWYWGYLTFIILLFKRKLFEKLLPHTLNNEGTDIVSIPIIDKVLLLVAKFEMLLVRRLNLPFGNSILIIVQK